MTLGLLAGLVVGLREKKSALNFGYIKFELHWGIQIGTSKRQSETWGLRGK